MHAYAHLCMCVSLIDTDVPFHLILRAVMDCRHSFSRPNLSAAPCWVNVGSMHAQ